MAESGRTPREEITLENEEQKPKKGKGGNNMKKKIALLEERYVEMNKDKRIMEEFIKHVFQEQITITPKQPLNFYIQEWETYNDGSPWHEEMQKKLEEAQKRRIKLQSERNIQNVRITSLENLVQRKEEELQNIKKKAENQIVEQAENLIIGFKRSQTVVGDNKKEDRTAGGEATEGEKAQGGGPGDKLTLSKQLSIKNGEILHLKTELKKKEALFKTQTEGKNFATESVQTDSVEKGIVKNNKIDYELKYTLLTEEHTKLKQEFQTSRSKAQSLLLLKDEEIEKLKKLNQNRSEMELSSTKSLSSKVSSPSLSTPTTPPKEIVLPFQYVEKILNPTNINIDEKSRIQLLEQEISNMQIILKLHINTEQDLNNKLRYLQASKTKEDINYEYFKNIFIQYLGYNGKNQQQECSRMEKLLFQLLSMNKAEIEKIHNSRHKKPKIYGVFGQKIKGGSPPGKSSGFKGLFNRGKKGMKDTPKADVLNQSFVDFPPGDLWDRTSLPNKGSNTSRSHYSQDFTNSPSTSVYRHTIAFDNKPLEEIKESDINIEHENIQNKNLFRTPNK